MPGSRSTVLHDAEEFAMAEVFLVVLRRADTVRALLSAAACLIAARSEAGEGRIDALAVRLPPAATIVGTEEVLTPQIADAVTEREQERVATLRVAFDAWASQSPHGVTLAWHDEEDDAEALVGRLGAAAEVIVLDLPQAGESDAEAGARHAALFIAARPVLLVPAKWQGSTLGRHVAIAWQDDPHAVGALRAAVPLQRPAGRHCLLRGGRPRGRWAYQRTGTPTPAPTPPRGGRRRDSPATAPGPRACLPRSVRRR
jgi:hypothetical protein